LDSPFFSPYLFADKKDPWPGPTLASSETHELRESCRYFERTSGFLNPNLMCQFVAPIELCIKSKRPAFAARISLRIFFALALEFRLSHTLCAPALRALHNLFTMILLNE
jgi:hypothetical protein